MAGDEAAAKTTSTYVEYTVSVPLKKDVSGRRKPYVYDANRACLFLSIKHNKLNNKLLRQQKRTNRMMRQSLRVLLAPVMYIRGGFRCFRAQFHYLWWGSRMASFKLQNERRAICEGCPIREQLKCGDCGCFLQEKVEIEKAVCPIGEW